MPAISVEQPVSIDRIGRHFNALHQVSQKLVGLRGDAAIAQQALWVLEEYLGYENGAILLTDVATGALTPFALSEQNQGESFVDLDRMHVASFRPALGRGITGWVAEHGKSILLGDVTTDSRYLAVRANIRSELCVPIRIDDRVIGVLNVESTRANAYAADDQRLLEIVATQIGMAIRLDSMRREAQAVAGNIEALVASRTHDLSAENVTLQRMVTIDALTEIGNRRGFDDVLALELRRAWRTSTPLSLLLLDVDCFKAYNDGYGHVAGDACLKRLAKSLALTVSRAGDYIARYGGEEFAVILPNTDAVHAMQVGERIQLRIAAENIPHARSTVAAHVTLSIGMATLAPRTQSLVPADIVVPADKALYQAKAAGRNRIVGLTI
jgi:diguanylate cyclase (GGDEF)-like protein